MDFSKGLEVATSIFEVSILVLVFSMLTIGFRNVYDTRKEILRRKELYNSEKKQVVKILKEIEDMQSNARYTYEHAESVHDKAKALYAYELVNDCLNRFKPIGVEKKRG